MSSIRFLPGLVLVLGLAPNPASACSCVRAPGSPQEELATFDAVLAGRVVEIVEPADWTRPGRSHAERVG